MGNLRTRFSCKINPTLHGNSALENMGLPPTEANKNFHDIPAQQGAPHPGEGVQ